MVVDRSGNMSDKPDGGTQSKLDNAKSALTGVVGLVPGDRWHMGLGAFPGSDAPIRNIQLLTNGNRQSPIDAIDGLYGNGPSPINEGLLLGSTMIQSVPKKRFILATSGIDLSPPARD